MTNYLDPAYFQQLYARDPDPWKFATSDYERDKYAATIEALPAPRFRRCFEAGCSIGVLTRQLAARYDAVLATDVADKALDQARTRCADLAHVQVQRMVAPTEWPEGSFDLMIFSEVLYYLGIPGLHEAAEMFITDVASTMRPVHQARAERYRLDVLRAA